MCRFVFYLLFSLTASLVHLQATAAVSPEVDEVVNQSLSQGMGYPEIIASLTAHPFNLSLENATAMAIEAGGDSHAEAFAAAGITIEWQGETGTVDEVGVDTATGNTVVRIDTDYFRPTEVDLLLGDPTKAKEKLGWTSKTSFDDLVKEMVEADLEMVRGTQTDPEKLLD